jgi:rare lipoprotein A
VIDLSRAAADRIGLASLGIKQVALTVIDREGMRCDGELAEPGEADAPSLEVAPVRPPQARPAATRKAPVRRAPARRR